MRNPKKSAEDILTEAREQGTGSGMPVLREVDIITLLKAGGRPVSVTISSMGGYYEHRILYKGHLFATTSPHRDVYFNK